MRLSPSRLVGLWWGTVRNEALERSVLAAAAGPAGVRARRRDRPVSRTPFAVRVPAEARRFGASSIRERVLLELPPERAPPQGAVLELRARPVAPRGPETGFDERGWLARRGVHVVLRGDADWRIVGRRGGIGGVGDRLRAHVVATLARGTMGERRRLLVGIVLGEDSGIDRELRGAFQASGLMHLLAVSGQNVAIVAFGVVMAARILGLGRLVGEALAILVVLSYALAVGWQPSVVRAAMAGTLASLAWIVARPRDRWHALAVGALVLLVWMPRSALEPGFQLSFAAVAAIFLVLPRMSGVPDAYPVPRGSLGRPRRRGRVRPRHGADRVAPLRPGCALDGAGERRGRAGDAPAHLAVPRRGGTSSPCCRARRPRSRGSPAGVRGGSRSSRGSSRAGRRRRSRRRPSS